MLRQDKTLLSYPSTQNPTRFDNKQHELFGFNHHGSGKETSFRSSQEFSSLQANIQWLIKRFAQTCQEIQSRSAWFAPKRSHQTTARETFRT